MRTQSLLTLFFAFALVAFTSPVSAGHSEDLLQDGNVWRTMHYVDDQVPAFPDIIGSPMLDGQRITSTEYYYGDNTWIDGVEYKVLLSDITTWFEPTNDPNDVRELSTIEAKYRGVLREDNDRIYFRNGQATSDELLYNFNLAVGDYLPTNSINPNGTLVVQNIDYITLGDNMVARFTVGTAAQPSVAQIVTGMGATTGLLEPLFDAGSMSEMLCFGVDGYTQFPAGSDGCGPEYISTPVEERHAMAPNTTTASLSPNPLGTIGGHQGKLVIESHDRKLFHYDILDTQGRLVEAGNGVSDTALPVDMSGYTAGLYYVRISVEGEENRPLNLKWMVQ